MSEFAETYRSLFLECTGEELKPEDGIFEGLIIAGETRLGVRFPEALRVYYQLAGNHELSRIENRFYPPDEIDWEGDYLPFWEENQVVCFWVYRREDLTLPNPIVYEGLNTDPVEWNSTEKTLPELLESYFIYLFPDEEAGELLSPDESI